MGLAFFVAFTTINLPYFWKTGDVRVHWLRAAMSLTGIGFVLYLLYVELFLAKLICLYCTGVHIVTFALFILIAVHSRPRWSSPRSPNGRRRRLGGRAGGGQSLKSSAPEVATLGGGDGARRNRSTGDLMAPTREC